MKELIIVGASGFGREVLQWVKDYNSVKPTWHIIGFLDDNLNALDGYICDYKILGTIKDWDVKETHEFAIAIANPQPKQFVVNFLKAKGANFATVIHPTAIISDFCSIGEGVVITPRAKVSPNVVIGNYVTLLGSGIGHDVVIGDFTTITGNCSINGNVTLGQKVFVGSNACIAPSKRIGNDVFIGMGSMVISNIKDGNKVIGNPAKKIDF